MMIDKLLWLTIKAGLVTDWAFAVVGILAFWGLLAAGVYHFAGWVFA